ncbi:MAG: toprim domain-containing protein [Synergistales bacterium]|nr:toprim domain-containing protein [Synergistales bacterium]
MVAIPSQRLSRINNDPPEEQFRQAVERAGLTPPPDLRMDGKIHRFHTGTGKKTEKSGWYVLYGGEIPAGAFGDWRDGDCYQTWRAEVSREVSLSEEQDIRERIKQAKEAREAEAVKVQGAAMDAARSIWEGAPDAPEDHPYLEKKGVKPHDIKVTVGDGRLIIPVYDSTGELVSLQYIDKEGNKQFHPGGKVSGCFYMIQGQGETIYMAEGYATAATIHEVTGSPVIVAFNAGNLAPVAQVAKVLYPNNPLTIVADNDVSGVGQAKAQEARDKTGANVIVTPVTGDANDYHLAGHDLKELLVGKQPEPRQRFPLVDICDLELKEKDWLVEDLIERDKLISIFGASGSGKSLYAMDLACCVATGTPFFGHEVAQGPAIYIVGEGFSGFPRRKAAWELHHVKIPRGVFFCSTTSASFLDPESEGDVIQAVREITKISGAPAMIVVDTLARNFGPGDENSNKDMSAFVAVLDRLKADNPGVTIVVVHHNGLSEKGRARGASAFRGALDTELMVERDDTFVTVTNTKEKEGPTGGVWTYRMEEVDLGITDKKDRPVTSAVLLQAGEREAAAPKARTRTANEDLGLATWRDAAEKYGQLDTEGNFLGVHNDDWQRVFYPKSTKEGAKLKWNHFNRVKTSLVDHNWMVVYDDMYKLGPAMDLGEMEMRLLAERLRGEKNEAKK